MPLRKSADTRKAEIVMAVLRLADELGPDRLTTLAVAKAVGVTQPGVFRHFPTKSELWLAVAAQISTTMTEAWQDVLEAEAAPLARIRGLIHVQFRQIAANPAIPAILTSRELHTENTALRAEFINLMTHFQALLVEALTEGRTNGVLRGDLAPNDAAILLISLVQGLAIRWSLGQRAFSLQAEGTRLLECQLALFQSAGPMETRP